MAKTSAINYEIAGSNKEKVHPKKVPKKWVTWKTSSSRRFLDYLRWVTEEGSSQA